MEGGGVALALAETANIQLNLEQPVDAPKTQGQANKSCGKDRGCPAGRRRSARFGVVRARQYFRGRPWSFIVNGDGRNLLIDVVRSGIGCGQARVFRVGYLNGNERHAGEFRDT